MRFLAIIVVSLFLSGTLYSQHSTFSELDVFDLQFVADPVISPDGQMIVYVRHQFDIMSDRRYTNLWKIDSDGNNHRPLTSGKNNYRSPVWSPDGKQIAYVSNEEGSSQIFVRWMVSDESVSITNLTNTPSNLSWSPDGEMLLFSINVPKKSTPMYSLPTPPEGANWAKGPEVIEQVRYRSDGNSGFIKEGYRQLMLIAADGGAPVQLSEGNFNHHNPQWAPDGKSVIFTSDRSGRADLDLNNAQIFEIDIESRRLTQLTDKRGPHQQPTISPDGNLIAFTGYEDQYVGFQISKLYLMSRDGSDIRKLNPDFDLNVSSIKWASDSKSLFFKYDEKGVSKVGMWNLDRGMKNVATDLASPNIGRPYGGGSYSVSNNGVIAYPKGSVIRPTELAVGGPGLDKESTITDLNGLFVQTKKMGEVNEFWVSSSVDDWEIQGWIITPPDFDPGKKYPMILEIHGGPYANYGPRFSPELQLMASRGYVVVYTNPRGSSSYGEEFASYINFNYPSEDFNDLMDAVDHVLERGYVDSTKLYITGGSGGGVLTAWAIGKTNRFAAAVVAKPVINWYSFALYADMYPYFTRYWFSAMPWEDPDQYLQRSPISLMGNVETPTMLLTGEDDFRTPMAESEQYYNALKLLEVDAAMVRIPEASHGIVNRPSNLFRKVGYILAWFERY